MASVAQVCEKNLSEKIPPWNLENRGNEEAEVEICIASRFLSGLAKPFRTES